MKRIGNIAIIVFILAFCMLISNTARADTVYGLQNSSIRYYIDCNGQIGLLTENSEEIVDPSWTEVSYFDDTLQANVWVNGKIGRIDRSGVYVIEPGEYEAIEALHDNNRNTILIAQKSKNNKIMYDLISLDGEKLYSDSVDRVTAVE